MWCIYTVFATAVVMFGQNEPRSAALLSRNEQTAQNTQIRCGRDGGERGELGGLQGFLGSEGQAHPRGPITEADAWVSHQQLPLSPPENQSQEAHPGFLHCQSEHWWPSPGHRALEAQAFRQYDIDPGTTALD